MARSNKVIESRINSYNLTVKFLQRTAAVLAVISFILLFISGPIGFVVFFVTVLPLLFISFKYDKKVKDELSDNVISVVVEEVFGASGTFDSDGRVNPGKMYLPFTYTDIYGEDLIRADYRGADVAISDLILKQFVESKDPDGMDSRVKTFSGQWMTINLKKELVGEVSIYSYSDKHEKASSDFTTDNVEFNSKFCIKADNPEEALKVLTPHLIEYILYTYNNLKDTELGLAFHRDGKVDVVFEREHDLFNVYDKSNMTIDGLSQEYYDELMVYANIVDTISDEKAIYK